MNKRILLVDDEQSVLTGIERRFGLDYEMSFANSGADGLNLIRTSEPFAVLVSDMRMPKMNGVEFLREAKALSPDSVAIMLTGNQDQQTAIQAVNEGQVYRFLNKPCSSDQLKSSLDSALRQYELVTGEKELLHKTFCGAVGVLAEVLEISHPQVFSRAAGIQEFVTGIQKRVGIDDRWEFKLASKLSLVGFALLPEADCFSLDEPINGDARSLEKIAKASEVGSKLIEKIPRLATVAAIIRAQVQADGVLSSLHPTSHADLVQTGGSLLRLAMYAECLSRQGISAAEGTREIGELLPALSHELSEVLQEIWPERVDLQTKSIALDELQTGLVLAQDVVTEGGAVLLRKGRRLSSTVIERLACHRRTFGKDQMFEVYSEEPSGNEVEQLQLTS